MGILNVTPDSFSDGGQFLDVDRAVEHAEKMAADGADIIDVGGESTRPGADPVAADEELRRVIPVIERLSKLGLATSIDTSKALVAHAALQAGAVFVNDVSGASDPDMAELCAKHDFPLCIMHMQGDPKTMQVAPKYDNVTQDVLSWLIQRAEFLRGQGIPSKNIWIDPGFGFGKTTEHNLELAINIGKFVSSGYKTLIGVSRKSFLGRVIGNECDPAGIEDRLEAGLIVQATCQRSGIRMIRTHDVAETVKQVKVTAALMRACSSAKLRDKVQQRNPDRSPK